MTLGERQKGRLRERKLWFYSVPNHTKQRIGWPAGALELLLLGFTCVCIQQCKARFSLFKSILQLIFVHEQVMAPISMRKMNHFIFSCLVTIKIGHSESFEGATIQGSFLKAYRTSEWPEVLYWVGSITKKNVKHRTSKTHLKVNFVALNPLKQKTMTLLIYL